MSSALSAPFLLPENSICAFKWKFPVQVRVPQTSIPNLFNKEFQEILESCKALLVDWQVWFVKNLFINSPPMTKYRKKVELCEGEIGIKNFVGSARVINLWNCGVEGWVGYSRSKTKHKNAMKTAQKVTIFRCLKLLKGNSCSVQVGGDRGGNGAGIPPVPNLNWWWSSDFQSCFQNPLENGTGRLGSEEWDGFFFLGFFFSSCSGVFSGNFGSGMGAGAPGAPQMGLGWCPWDQAVTPCLFSFSSAPAGIYPSDCPGASPALNPEFSRLQSCSGRRNLPEIPLGSPILALIPKFDFRGGTEHNFQLSNNHRKELQALGAVIRIINSHTTAFSKFIFPFLHPCCYPCLPPIGIFPLNWF